jgi:serine/threonine-protein kinase RsbW
VDNNISLSIQLPNIPAIELVAIVGLEQMGRYLGIPDDKIGEAKIVVTEAIINGLEHAGENTPYVDVEFYMSKEELVISVTDFGKGFNPETVQEPDIAQKLSSNNKRGWGMKLMKTMSDSMTIESGSTGTRISIKKNLK